ncbi:MAG: hypothetical protein WCL32_17300 [Planctomycetota bacterium]
MSFDLQEIGLGGVRQNAGFIVGAVSPARKIGLLLAFGEDIRGAKTIAGAPSAEIATLALRNDL